MDEDHIGAAEVAVGRYIYRRIEALMDAKPGTHDAAELAYLADIAEYVEEYGEDACGDLPLGKPPPSRAINRTTVSRIRELEWAVGWSIVNSEECLGDHPEHLARAQKALTGSETAEWGERTAGEYEALGRACEAAGLARFGDDGEALLRPPVDELREAQNALFIEFEGWLTERANWLRYERDRGGDWEHLLTREKELGYVAQKFRQAFPKAAGGNDAH